LRVFDFLFFIGFVIVKALLFLLFFGVFVKGFLDLLRVSGALAANDEGADDEDAAKELDTEELRTTGDTCPNPAKFLAVSMRRLCFGVALNAEECLACSTPVLDACMRVDNALSVELIDPDLGTSSL